MVIIKIKFLFTSRYKNYDKNGEVRTSVLLQNFKSIFQFQYCNQKIFKASSAQHFSISLIPSSKTLLCLKTGSKWCRCVMFIARNLLERWSFLQEISVKVKKSITSAVTMAKLSESFNKVYFASLLSTEVDKKLY